MTKTFDDYLNDPRLKNEPMGLRMAHAMRFKVQDDTAGMTASEITDYYHEGTKAAFSRLGITPKYTSPYREDS
jgi:Zn/Cd-binding protein ZinT